MGADNVLVLNWADFADLRKVIDDAKASSLLWRDAVSSAADRAIQAWLQGRGVNSLSDFYLRHTDVIVEPRAERFSAYRELDKACPAVRPSHL